MGLFKKDTPKLDDPTPAERRAATMSTFALPDWAESCLFAVGRNLSDFRRSAGPETLDEAVEGAEALVAVLKELRHRRQTGDL
jgi:hypothetical protein